MMTTSSFFTPHHHHYLGRHQITLAGWLNDQAMVSNDDRDDDVLFRDDNDDGDDLPSYYSSPSNTEQLDYEELQPPSSCQAPSEDYVGPSSANQEHLDALDDTIVQYTITAVNHRAQATCVGCEINHPSQLRQVGDVHLARGDQRKSAGRAENHRAVG